MRVFVMTLCLVAASALVSGQFVDTESDNLLSRQLEGLWQPEATLQNPPMVDAVTINEIEFVRKDAEFARFASFEKLEGEPEIPVYFSGLMTLTINGVKDEPRAVVLGTYEGLPTLIFLKNNNDADDLEFFNVGIFSRGRLGNFLLVGGDSADEPMTAFKKVAPLQE